MRNQGLREWGASLALAITTIGSQNVSADVVRTQIVELESGWNAVYLLVEPVETDPNELFGTEAIDVVAAYFPARSTAQYIADPSADGLQNSGWGVWYAPNRSDAFLTNLHAIHGARGYLIHAIESAVLEIDGGVEPVAINWRADHFNFVGFSLDPQAPPTFSEYFAASPELSHDNIYQLREGSWERVTRPESRMMRSGEAFWIFSEGATDYTGPVTLSTRTRVGLLLQGSSDSVTLRNLLDHPVTATLEHVPSGDYPVPLSLLVDLVGAGASGTLESVAFAAPKGPWNFEMPPMEARSAIELPMELRLESMERRYHSSLLKVSTDIGVELWIPVIGVRGDLDE